MAAISLLEEMGDFVELERALQVQTALHKAYGSDEAAKVSSERAQALRNQGQGKSPRNSHQQIT